MTGARTGARGLYERRRPGRDRRGELGGWEVALEHTHYGLREGDVVGFTTQHRPPDQPRVENGTRGQVARVDELGAEGQDARRVMQLAGRVRASRAQVPSLAHREPYEGGVGLEVSHAPWPSVASPSRLIRGFLAAPDRSQRDHATGRDR